MDLRDPFPRRTASIPGLVPWIGELAKTLPGLIGSYLPGGPIDPRTRERVIMAVTEVNGCRYCAWIHGGWEEFLGDRDVDVDEALLTYARACAEAGEPLDPSPLASVLPPEAVQAVRATVAQIEVSNLVGNTVDGLLARLTRKRPLATPDTLSDAATVAAALPLAVPMLGIAAALRALTSLAPELGGVEQPSAGEANLLTHLLAQAVPAWLGNAALRLVLLGLPFPLTIGVRAGRTTSTVTIGKGEVRIANGISPTAIIVVEGDVEPLLQLATGNLVRELRSVRIRPNQ